MKHVWVESTTTRWARAVGLVFLFVAAVSCGEDAQTPATPTPPDPTPPVDTTTPPPPPPDTATVPTQSSSDLMFTAVSATAISLAWTNGDGDKRIVVVREGSPVDATPSDGQVYAADTLFGAGDDLGSGDFVVFAGAGSGVTFGGLTPDSAYHVAVFEYNGDSTDTKYLASTTAISNQTTAPPPSLVGGWLWGAAGAPLSAVVSFLTDSTYMVVDDGTADGGGQPGMERGTYFWDDNNTASGDFTVGPLTDTSGDWGFSDPAPKTVSVRGDTLVLTVGGDVEAAVRVKPSDSNELVGTWLLQDPADANRLMVITILDDSNYMLGADDTPDSTGWPGMERGTYTWNAASGAFTSTAATDTNGDLGLNPLIRNGTATVSGDTLTYVSAGGPIALLRIR